MCSSRSAPPLGLKSVNEIVSVNGILLCYWLKMDTMRRKHSSRMVSYGQMEWRWWSLFVVRIISMFRDNNLPTDGFPLIPSLTFPIQYTMIGWATIWETWFWTWGADDVEFAWNAKLHVYPILQQHALDHSNLQSVTINRIDHTLLAVSSASISAANRT